MSQTLVRPVFKPQIDFDVATEFAEERSTIVHCLVTDAFLIRIWPSTYLIQEDGTRKNLLFAYNISPYPEWKWVRVPHRFTLVFEGLDKGCEVFDLLEEIPEPGGFEVSGIRRNRSDVYQVTVD